MRPGLRPILTLLAACVLAPALRASGGPALGTPVVRNFSKEACGGGTQNWDGYVDPAGVVWMANNEGVLAYDGSAWSKHPLPRRTIVRSVTGDGRGVVFAGGQGEWGLFRPVAGGRLVYEDLTRRVPVAERGFEDVWDLVLHGDRLFARASGRLYVLEPGGADSATVHRGPAPLDLLALAGETLYAHDAARGLTVWRDGRGLVPPAAEPVLPGVLATAVLEADSGAVIVATLKSGLFRVGPDGSVSAFAGGLARRLAEHRVYTARRLADGRYALGTTTDGLLILGPDGTLEGAYGRAEGLQYPNVLSLVEDRSGNLWLGLDNGIDLVAVASAYTRFFPDGDLRGTAYAMVHHDGLLYAGTNNGLYVLDPSEPFGQRRFRFVPGTRGQVWSLSVHRGALLMGHHEGAFVIRRDGLRKLADVPGVWLFREPPLPGETRALVFGAYDGLHRLAWRDGWVYEGPVEGFSESARFLAFGPKGRLWIAHPYKGLWSAALREGRLEELRFHGQDEGLPGTNGLKVFPVGEEAVVTVAGQGAWRYDAERDRFVPHERLGRLLGGEADIRALLPGEGEDLWCALGGSVLRLHILDRGVDKTVETESLEALRGSLVPGFEFLYDPPGPDVFFASDRGFVQYREGAARPRPGGSLLLRRVWAGPPLDSVAFAGYGGTEGLEPASFPPYQRSYRFGFSATEHERPERTTYAWRLRGFESDWSAPSAQRSKEYTNLHPGDYVFEVKARDAAGRDLGLAAYAFRIRRPWYATSLAFVIYLLVAITGLSALVLAPRRHFAKERVRIERDKERTLAEQEAKHQETVQTTNRAMDALRNEKLRGEIDHQNRQLAMTTMHLVQKNAMITRLREEVARIEAGHSAEDVRKATRNVLSLLDSDDRLDEDWEQFALHFDKVHTDFLARLRKRFPQLTPKDQKLCAFLRLNLSSKEIAPLLNISVRGVEISRYRLRKKLELDTDVNLVDYLMAI